MVPNTLDFLPGFVAMLKVLSEGVICGLGLGIVELILFTPLLSITQRPEMWNVP